MRSRLVHRNIEYGFEDNISAITFGNTIQRLLPDEDVHYNKKVFDIWHMRRYPFIGTYNPDGTDKEAL
jgi:hypothetical protein